MAADASNDFGIAETALAALVEGANSQRTALGRHVAGVTAVKTALQGIKPDAGALLAAIQTGLAANPNDPAWQVIEARAVKLHASFTDLLARAVHVETATLAAATEPLA